MNKFEFAIKKDILNSGEIVHTPVCREKSKFPLLFNKPWNRIVKIYDQYVLMELDFIPKLSHEECKAHVQGYQEYMKQQVASDIAVVTYDTLEEKEL